MIKRISIFSFALWLSVYIISSSFSLAQPLKKPKALQRWKFADVIDMVYMPDAKQPKEVYIILKSSHAQRVEMIGITAPDAPLSQAPDKEDAEYWDTQTKESNEQYVIQLPTAKKFSFKPGERPLKIVKDYVYTTYPTKRRSVSILYRYRYTRNSIVVADSVITTTDKGCLLTTFWREHSDGALVFSTTGRPGNTTLQSKTMKVWSAELRELFQYTYRNPQKYATIELLGKDTMVIVERDDKGKEVYLSFYSALKGALLFEKTITLSDRYEDLYFCHLPALQRFALAVNWSAELNHTLLYFSLNGELMIEGRKSEGYSTQLHYHNGWKKIITQYDVQDGNKIVCVDPTGIDLAIIRYAAYQMFPPTKEWRISRSYRIVCEEEGEYFFILYSQYAPLNSKVTHRHCMTVNEGRKITKLDVPDSNESYELQLLNERKFLLWSKGNMTMYQY